MGVPFGILCAGVNINDVTHRAFSTGLVRRPTEDERMKQSLSDAINIQLPYNLERLLFYLTDENHDQVKAWYDRLEGSVDDDDDDDDVQQQKGGCMDLKQSATTTKDTTINWLTNLQTEFRSARVTDEQLCATMNRVLDDYGYWVDPHTGVAFAAAEQLGYLNVGSDESSRDGEGDAKNKVVALMATASPCKFQNAMTTALGKEKWEEYERDQFPSRGKNLKDKAETPPTAYLAEPGKSLEENQLLWEAKTRELIDQLG